MDLIGCGALEWIQPDDKVEVGTIVINDPSVLQYPPVISAPCRVSRVVIDATYPATETEGSQFYCADDVTQRAMDLFGVRPLWQRYIPDNGAPQPEGPEDAGPPPEGEIVELALGKAVENREIVVELDKMSRGRFALVRIPMRSLADGERGDEVVVVYRHGDDQNLMPWLQRMSDSHSATERWALSDSLPDHVVLVIASREGLVQLSSRLPIVTNTSSTNLSTNLTVFDAPTMWTSATWWSSSSSRRVVLRHPHARV